MSRHCFLCFSSPKYSSVSGLLCLLRSSWLCNFLLPSWRMFYSQFRLRMASSLEHSRSVSFYAPYPEVPLKVVLKILDMIACITRKQFCLICLHTDSCLPPRLHHTKLPQYMREMKKYHLAHHYKNFELGYGVTSEPFAFRVYWISLRSFVGKIWDYVFGTVLRV